MVLMTTTYRHDFVPPKTNRYHFLPKAASTTEKLATKLPQDCDRLCYCAEKYNLSGSAAVPAAAKTTLKSEWTGIAPMGLLVDPRIIPKQPNLDDINDTDNYRSNATACMEDQPNRFLKILRTCYPDLYDRLNQMPQNELKRRLDVERLKTTYQIDFCGFSEYPDGLYNSLDTPDNNKNAKSGSMNPNCSGLENGAHEAFKAMTDKGDECLKTYKPFKANFSDSPAPVGRGDNSSHWTVNLCCAKKPRISEYMETVSRTGCVIRKNKIHSHDRCNNGRNCLHKLKYPCKTFK